MLIIKPQKLICRTLPQTFSFLYSTFNRSGTEELNKMRYRYIVTFKFHFAGAGPAPAASTPRPVVDPNWYTSTVYSRIQAWMRIFYSDQKITI